LSEAATLALREQFATPAQQRETASIGMWIFIVSEMMIFSALFVAFAVYRLTSPHPFDLGSGEMELTLGTINTILLVCSSFTMALAVYNAESGNQRWLVLFLLITMFIGCLFVGIKLTEYYDHFRDHKVPALWFHYAGSSAGKVQMFFVFYFIMTGLHVIHLLVGLGLLLVMVIRSLAGAFTPEYHTPILMTGVYWSFVDVIWVFLYAIFYVPGFHVK
jgi:cytochrome c oxidase subunit III